MRFTVTIETDGAAFDGDHREEVARLLRGLARNVEDEPWEEGEASLIDHNGNTVGTVTVGKTEVEEVSR